MLLEPLRIVADWIANPVHGTNAELRLLPRDVADVALVPFVTVYDASRHAWVSRAEITAETPGMKLPALAVLAQDDVTMDGEIGSVFRDGRVNLAIAYLTDEPESAEAMGNALYTLRATARSLAGLLANGAEASRERNQIVLRACSTMRLGLLHQARGAVTMIAALVLAVDLRDLAPLHSTSS